MRRVALINYKATTRVVDVSRELRASWHLHFCRERECRVVYDCYGCEDPAVNGRCHACRGLRRPVWDASRDPRPCCHGNCSQVTAKEELVRYRLAGPGPWFKCHTCARCHGWPCNRGGTEA